MCYSPGFYFAVRGAAFVLPFGSFPKISTTVENTVENPMGRMS
jgi:hypothetical protein